jgi:hypothetical protein
MPKVIPIAVLALHHGNRGARSDWSVLALIGAPVLTLSPSCLWLRSSLRPEQSPRLTESEPQQ